MIPRDRLLPAIAMGLAGGAVMLAMLGTLEGNVFALILPAVGGAFLSGLACADLFRLPGAKGLAVAALGAVAATLLGAAIAGLGLGLLLGPTIAGALVAPYAVAEAIMKQPTVLVTWIVSMSITCVLFRRTAQTAVPIG